MLIELMALPAPVMIPHPSGPKISSGSVGDTTTALISRAMA